MGAGVIGVEADISYSPDFYGKSDVGGSSNLSFMGNMILGVPFGGQQGFGVRPYAIGGIGMIRSEVNAFGEPFKVEENQFGWDFGGGVMMFFGNRVGLRGEVRYFRTFDDFEFLGIELGGFDRRRGLHARFARSHLQILIRRDERGTKNPERGTRNGERGTIRTLTASISDQHFSTPRRTPL